MNTSTATPSVGLGRTKAIAAGSLSRRLSGGVALVFLFLATMVPLWQAKLNAPQYPDGLKMTAYGDRVEGDIDEINILNHYIGMKPLKWDEIPERLLWKPGLAAAAIVIVLTTLVRNRTARRWLIAATWLLPIGVIADIQFRLYQYGHDLNEEAALRVPKFTIWVFGPTKIWNFSTWALPGVGLLLLLAAAATVTFGPKAPRWIKEAIEEWKAAPAGALALLMIAVLAAPTVLAAPAAAQEGSQLHHMTAGPAVDLQELLDRAPPGSHIVLEPGTYHGSFEITRPLSLIGTGATLHGNGSGSVLTISGDDVVVEGLEVGHSAPGPVGSPAGIDVRGDNVTLSDISVTDSYLGISVQGSDGVEIVNATVTGRDGTLGDTEHAIEASDGHGGRQDMAEGRGDGISLINSSNVLVRGSRVEATRDGFYLSFAEHVMLDGNLVFDGRYGIHSMYAEDLTIASNRISGNVAGLVMMYGGQMMIIDNELTDNTSASTGFGVLVKDVDSLEAAKNIISGNRVGIHVEGPPGAAPGDQRFVLNTVALNGIGAAIFPSAIATFSGNSFVENYVQVVPFGGKVAPDVSWTEHGAGNYWSNYRGFDDADDGVGDTPHRESGLTSKLLDENPGLYAFLGSPALGLATTSHERWAPSGVGILDELPLMEPHSPKVPASPATDGRQALVWLAIPLLMLAGAALYAGTRSGGMRTRGVLVGRVADERH